MNISEPSEPALTEVVIVGLTCILRLGKIYSSSSCDLKYGKTVHNRARLSCLLSLKPTNPSTQGFDSSLLQLTCHMDSLIPSTQLATHRTCDLYCPLSTYEDIVSILKSRVFGAVLEVFLDGDAHDVPSGFDKCIDSPCVVKTFGAN